MQEQTTYPEWQKAIREAQAKRNAERAQKEARAHEAWREKMREEGKLLERILNELGIPIEGHQIHLPESEYSSEYVHGHMDDLRFSLNRKGFTTLTIMKKVPKSTDAEFEALWDDGFEGYHLWASASSRIDGTNKPEEIADMIDVVNRDAQKYAIDNIITLERWEAWKAKEEAEDVETPAPSTTDQLVDALWAVISDRIRENIAQIISEMELT